MFYRMLFILTVTALPFLVVLPLLMEGDVVDRFILGFMILVTMHLMVCSVVYRFDRQIHATSQITVPEIVERNPGYRYPRTRRAK